MTVGELGSLAQLVVETVDRTTLDAAQQDASFVNLKEVTDRFLVAVNRSAFSKQTEAVNAAAAERLRCLKGLRNIVANQAASPDLAVAALARPMNQVFSQFGTNVDRMKPIEQTIYIQSLINELKSTTTDAQRASAHVNAWFDALELAVIEFNKLFVVRGNDQIDIKNSPSATSLRRELRQSIIDFMTFVKASRISTRNPEWQTLEQQIEHRIEATGRTIVQRPRTNTTSSTTAAPAAEKPISA